MSLVPYRSACGCFARARVLPRFVRLVLLLFWGQTALFGQIGSQADGERSRLFQGAILTQTVPPLRLAASWQSRNGQTLLVTQIGIPPGYHLNRDLLQIDLAAPKNEPKNEPKNDFGENSANDFGNDPKANPRVIGHLLRLQPLRDYPEPSAEAEGIYYYSDSLELEQPLGWAAIQTSAQTSVQNAAALAPLRLQISYQLCLEDGSCFLPTVQSYEFRFEQLADRAGLFWEGLRAASAQHEAVRSLLWFWLQVLLFSFVGGMILNVMPCILPIFFLKLQKLLRLLGLSSQNAQREMGSWAVYRRGLGSLLGTLVGIQLSFLLLGLLLLPWSGLLWGAPLQQAAVVYALVLLLFVMGLSLLGLFHFRAPRLPRFFQIKSAAAKSRINIWGDIGHGALIVVLGTPCSAPLLAPALGFFLLQGQPLLSFAGLSLIGLGLWLPYAALGFSAMRRRCLRNKNGGSATSLRFLQSLQRCMPLVEGLMGFAMLALALWLLSVLQQQLAPQGLLPVLWSLGAVALCAWLWQQRSVCNRLQSKRARRLCAWLFVLPVLLTLWLLFWAGAAAVQGRVGESALVALPRLQDWDIESIDSPPRFLGYEGTEAERRIIAQWLRRRGPVFVEYTADWCITCKFNQRVLLHTERFAALLQKHQVLYLKADLTTPKPRLQAELNRWQRASLPVYALYLLQDPLVPHLLPTLPRYTDFAALLEP